MLHHPWARDQEKSGQAHPHPKSFVTQHQGVFRWGFPKIQGYGKGDFLKNAEGDSVATLWSVAILKWGAEQIKKTGYLCVQWRSWICLGLAPYGNVRPKIVTVDSDAKEDDGAAPYTLTENKYGLLDLTDLVFIDPIGTGYSRVVGKGKEKDFWD